MKFLNLIRWKNLVILALVQLMIKYALLEPFIESTGIATTLQPFGFMMLVLATLCIAAAGYAINDLYDLETDRINKPQKLIVGNGISEKQVTRWFIILNVLGVGLGYLVSYHIGKSDFFAIFIIISGLLYVYSAYLKQYPLIGNLAVSACIGFSILLVGIYDLLPAMTQSNRSVQLTFFEIILDYALFAFLITLLRELVKDIEDFEGDAVAGYQTLPVQFGKSAAKYLSLLLNLVLAGLTVYYVMTYLYKNEVMVFYFLIFITAPLIFTALKLWQAKEKKDFSKVSLLLKFIMISGIFSMLVFNLSQLWHA
jgi:4-hydroxybenzoate polyprenyltransferase